MRRTSLHYVAVAVVMTLLASSCVKRNLYVKPDEGTVILDIDWKNLVAGETAPQQMSLYFYGEDGTLMRGTTENGTFTTVLPSGYYKVLAVNEDVDGVGFNSMSEYDKAYAYALPLNKLAKAEEEWVRQPGWVYGGHLLDMNIIKQDTIQTTVVPEPMVQRVSMNIYLKGDYDAVTEMSAALTGVAASVLLSTGKCNDYAAITQLEPQLVAENHYTANALVFGVAAVDPEVSIDNQVRLELSFNNGGSQVLEETITNDVIEDPTATEININVEIAVSANSEVGFTATITGWEVTTGDMSVDNRPNDPTKQQ